MWSSRLLHRAVLVHCQPTQPGSSSLRATVRAGNQAGGFLSCFPSLLLTLLLCFGQVWSHHFSECASNHWQLLASFPQFTFWAWYQSGGKHPFGQFWTSVCYQHYSHPKSKTVLYKLLRRKTDSIPAQAVSWFPSTPTPSGSYFLYHDRVESGGRECSFCWLLLRSLFRNVEWKLLRHILIHNTTAASFPVPLFSDALNSCHGFLCTDLSTAAPQGYFCQIRNIQSAEFCIEDWICLLQSPSPSAFLL